MLIFFLVTFVLLRSFPAKHNAGSGEIVPNEKSAGESEEGVSIGRKGVHCWSDTPAEWTDAHLGVRLV